LGILGLALQCSPEDLEQAAELVQLLVDIERTRRKDCEFILFARKDCDQAEVRRIHQLLGSKFTYALAVEPWDFATGWPHGPNSMWASLMRQLFDMARNGAIKADGVLTFEPDCIPITIDWIDQLSSAWALARARGIQVLGHQHPSKESATHVNGNAIFATNFWQLHEEITGCHGMLPWDVAHARIILPVSEDTALINQFYRMNHFEHADWCRLAQSACVFFHGVKTAQGRALARQELLGGPQARALTQVLAPEPILVQRPAPKGKRVRKNVRSNKTR
jgi:hypothetical protein